jgi:ornithine carbamoyltransferase
MWQRFTDGAKRIIFWAQQEAFNQGSSYVSPEHMVLGVCKDPDSVAAAILGRMGIPLEPVRTRIAAELGDGLKNRSEDMLLTPRAKRVIDLAYEESRALNNDYIGSEHLLLGVLREGENAASRVLAGLGATLDHAREEVIKLQNPSEHKEESGAPRGSTVDTMYAIKLARREIAEDTLGLRGKSLLSVADLTPEQFTGILNVAAGMVEGHRTQNPPLRWAYPKALAMIFEKPSLRTRVTFDLGMRQLGGITTILGPAEIGLGVRESVADVARNLERVTDGIMARVFDHKVLVQLRDSCSIPIINGLSDLEHPCQALADLFTIQQKKGTLSGLKLAWVGDGNNVLHSLLLAGALTGMSVTAACPAGYEPLPAVLEQARALSVDDAKLEVVTDPAEAARDADVIYTDVWTSMGQEKEQIARLQAFRSYQVNAELMAHAKPDAVFMHCLPAHRGDEVTEDVIDGPQSVVFDQAENRLHAQKAVLALLLGP